MILPFIKLEDGRTVYSVDTENTDLPEALISTAITVHKWCIVRTKRDKLIEAYDSTYLRHEREVRSGKVVDDADNPTTLSSVQLAELDTYVQALADIPQTYVSPDDVIWPEKPSI